MRVSSITVSSIEHTFKSELHAGNIIQTAQHITASLLKTLDHIGTAIALGEKGDLEAADAFRRKSSGQ
jgi:hypothetical protein